MKTQNAAKPYDHCHTCQRKVLKGVVECVKCYMERLYGKGTK